MEALCLWHRKGTSIETEYISSYPGLGVGSQKDCQWEKGLLEEDDGNVLKLDCGYDCTTHNFSKNIWIVHLKQGILRCVHYASTLQLKKWDEQDSDKGNSKD